MRRAAKVDANQSDIVTALRACGAVVDVVSSLPGLGYDLVVMHRQRVWKVEVKDGSLKPSARKLTESELRAQAESGPCYVVLTSVNDALKLLEADP